MNPLIEYKPDPINHPNSTFGFSYLECRDKYLEFVNLDDSEFKTRAVEILHLAVFICWFKGTSAHMVLSDFGLIHLLVHQLHLPDGEETTANFQMMRQQFNDLCKLV